MSTKFSQAMLKRSKFLLIREPSRMVSSNEVFNFIKLRIRFKKLYIITYILLKYKPFYNKYN